MTSFHRPRARRRKHLVGLSAAFALTAALVAASPAAAVPDPGTAHKADTADHTAEVNRQIAAGGIPGVDEVAHSDNVSHLANLPKQDPFTTPTSFGTDIAFQGRYAYDGNYDGFVIYDISRPSRPRIVSQVLCPGSQNDVSVSGNLLYLSTDSSRSDNSCASTSQPASEKSSWEGIKVFDISDKANPKYIAAVETDCGSHTHTLVPDKEGRNDYLYISSYAPRPEFPDCQPPHDGISIVKIPRKNPAAAAVVATPVLFPDGGNPGSPGHSATSGCHDITAFPGKDLAAGACMGDGILLDISDREAPKLIDRVQDTVNFAFWHSATFNRKASKVVFTDELGGGGAATCNEATGSERGADGIYDIIGHGDQRKLVFRGYYKIPRRQADTENCVAHNGSLLPAKGRDIMVQAWYQGGVSVWDFTDSAHPKEIGWFERGPISTDTLAVGGAWSAYYYNGHIFSSDIQKGLDVLKISDRRTDSGARVHLDRLNVQTQPDYRR
ncbi:LVIVD repeat-containing protein [Wenjunlia tyrosinilytica]|uniref:LVIVD repeat-containing protein n=1 Tax=Wenjunlia tyrosinilytica TaxID=1544741 RepID=A0A917ZTQ3_9ACTN|nr:hypothetical protein [Wenjunlia tyrosinilytica]GGO91064.1 hypothetical protein GCM10012280_38070 [Wenjunlia tyrosinilytica]